jgi:hypothetical protein
MSDSNPPVVAPAAREIAKPTAAALVVPKLIADMGNQAARRFNEFFVATISNRSTRMAYHRAVMQFFAWCGQPEVRTSASSAGPLYQPRYRCGPLPHILATLPPGRACAPGEYLKKVAAPR